MKKLFTRETGWLLLAALGITLAAAWLYAPILQPAQGLYPWGSDALGHLMKIEYVRDQLARGIAYPDLFPNWYFGAQILRYYAPLPYLLVIWIANLSGLPLITALQWLIALCAWLGALLWLPYRRWIGIFPAALGGLLFLILPDNVRVAFAEGNYPRMVTTALLPLLFYLLLRALSPEASRRHWLLLALTFAIVTVSHAMLAAIYAACAALLTLMLLLLRQTDLRRAFLGLAAIALGIALSGWWLLPSLSGGITEIDTSYWSYITLPWAELLNPLLFRTSRDLVYIGLSLMLLPLLFMAFIPKMRSPHALALIILGVFGIVINTYGFNQLYNALPLTGLLMPYRFLGVSSFALLLALLWQAAQLPRKHWAALGLAVVVALDSAGWLPLIHLRPTSPELLQIASELRYRPGWREATFDVVGLGPAPSYLFTALGEREQIYGWSYYASRAATTISALEDALLYHKTAYISDRLDLYGVDDVVVMRRLSVFSALENELLQRGFARVYDGATTALYHREGAPRAVIAEWEVLGIGTGAGNVAYNFPQLIRGTSHFIDDYTLQELTRYRVLLLSGFRWHNREFAETLVAQAAEQGVTVLVDLTRIPEDPVARIARFLGVYGEPIVLAPQPIVGEGNGEMYMFMPFGENEALWHTFTPQGMSHTTLTFDYLGQTGTLLGYNQYDAGKVWFLGLNLPYHLALTNDPEAARLLGGLLGLPMNTRSTYTTVALQNYQADAHGYRFDYQLPQAARLLFPVAFHDGMVVQVDGTPVETWSYENLLAFAAPAGEHRVEIVIETTTVYFLGKVSSVLAALILAAGLWWGRGWLARYESD